MAKKNERVKVKDIEKALDQDERIELWISKNWHKCAAGVIALIAVIVVGFVIYLKYNENIQKKTVEIAEAAPEDLPALLAESQDVPGANVARIRLAQYLFGDKKDYTGAASEFEKIANDTTLPMEVRSNARLSVASCLEASGKKQAACEAFAAIAEDAVLPQSLKCEAALQASRLLLSLNGRDQAEKMLQGIVDLEIPAAQMSPSVQSSKMYAEILLAAIRNGDFN